MPVEPIPYESPKPRHSLVSASSLAIAIAWSVIVAFGGGLACGWCVSVDEFGELGSLSLAACGALAGFVSHKITRGPSKLAGWAQVIATCLAFFIAETCWLHWNTHNGEPGWWVAASLWPVFVREYKLAAVIGAACTAYGAWCAYGYATSANRRTIVDSS